MVRVLSDGVSMAIRALAYVRGAYKVIAEGDA